MSDKADTSLKHVILQPGVKRGKPGKPPQSIKGRTLRANNVGPWDMLKAMRRVQLGEPLHRVARSYGISHNTLQRWQTRWGGDVAHVRWGLDVEHVQKAEAAYAKLERRLARSLYRLKMRTDPASVRELCLQLHASVQEDLACARAHMQHVTGDGHKYWRAKREAAAHIEPSVSRYRLVKRLQRGKGSLENKLIKQRVGKNNFAANATLRDSSYWDNR